MAKNSKIIGVDPGTNVLGYAVIDCEPRVPIVKDIGVIKLSGYNDHYTKLKEIYLQLQEIIEVHLPGQMAIEAPFFGKNVQSMLKLGRAQGVSMAAAITMGIDVIEYSPKKIKQAITGNGNSSKEQVAAMLKHRLKFTVSEYYLDATDALAAAVCHHQQISNGRQISKSGNSWKKFIAENPQRVKKS